MVTIASTPEKTLETLTGEECIPLSDKTHIKTSILKDLADHIKQVEDAVDERVMYRCEYDFTTAAEIAAVQKDDTISFGTSSASGASFTCGGTINIQVPHRGKYYVTILGATGADDVKVQNGTNIYALASKIILTFDDVTAISFTISGDATIEHIIVVETPLVIADVANEEIDKRQSYVDNDCLILKI